MNLDEHRRKSPATQALPTTGGGGRRRLPSLLALLFLADGHWILGVFLGVVAAVAVVVLAQIRSVR